MAVSPAHDSSGTITCKKLKRKSATSVEPKVKQRNAIWERKRMLAEQRLMDLTSIDKNEEESITVEKPRLLPPKESPTNDVNTSVSVPKISNTAVETPLLLPPKESPNDDVNASVGVSNSTMERAQVIKDSLPLKTPSFVKLMLKSHVSGGFWLGLPKRFCVAHLPKRDETVTLVGDNEEEYDTRYLVEKIGLSGGWRGFSIAHKLLAGDVLVYQLIEPRKFKVHIVRGNSTETDGVKSLQNLSFHVEPIEEGILIPFESLLYGLPHPKSKNLHVHSIDLVKMEGESRLITEAASNKCLELVNAENDKIKDIGKLVCLSEHVDDNHESSLEAMDGIRFSESVLTFKDVKGFEDFHIHVDGLMIDAEIPLHLRTKYYKLCRSQNTFLHENLMRGLNTKLAAGMISETINIADAIRAAKPGAGANHLQMWDTTLKAFEALGMGVRFLCARIDKLLALSREVEAAIELKRSERAEAKEEMRCLNMKLLDVKLRMQNLDAEIDGLVTKKEELSEVFKEVAAAPW